jgi:ABC-type microcin C transport system permease subunit YejB
LTQSIRRLPAESYLARESHPAHSHSSPRTGGATLRLSGTTARTFSAPAEHGKDAHRTPFLSDVTRASPSTRNTRAKGVPEKKVINYHAFRNTLTPLVTTLGGSLPGLFSGALITETLFSIRGIGYASYTSMTQGDIPFIMFYLAFISILTLLGNLISDLLYAVVDPRVRLS